MCTTHDFSSMFGHFTILCMKGLNLFNIRSRIWRRSLSWLPTPFLSYFIRQRHGVVSYWFVFLYQITANNSKLSNIYIISYIGFNTNLNFCKKSQFSMKRLDNKSSNNDLRKKLCILCSTDSSILGMKYNYLNEVDICLPVWNC